MPGSTISVFGEPDDYQSALRSDGGFELLVTGRGEFRAELIRIELPRMHLVVGVESVARVAFISQPDRLVRISLPLRSGTAMFRNGAATRTDEIMTHGPGQRMHERTEGPCRWRTIWVPIPDLIGYGIAMTGAEFDVPPGVCRWRPPREPLRQLNRLHDDATRMSRVQPSVVLVAEAIHCLQQELIGALIECMQVKPTSEAATAHLWHIELMNRFEDLLGNYPDRLPSIGELCARLKVSDRTLRLCCHEHLGMSPHRYLHQRQMHHARRALRGGVPGVTRVSDVARRCGFGALGRFAAAYREQFGELPSATIGRRTRGAQT